MTARLAPQVPAWPLRLRLLRTLERAPWGAIGRSVHGRPIARAAMGRGPVTLVVGGVHGDEPASGEVCLRLWRALLARPLPRRAGRIVIVPVLNPDGFAAHAKNNARDVDLNRNFPTRNFGAHRRVGYDPGQGPASEPETRALLALCERIQPARIVAVHQPFECVNYDGPARVLAQAVAQACGYPARADLGYPTPGSMGTYFGVERELPILTLELGARSPAREWPSAQRALMAALAHH